MSEKTCFVIAPIGSDGSPTRKRSDKVLRYVIRPTVERLGYKAIRADEISEPGSITNQVILRIAEAELVVADLSERNANVFYELAIRHGLRKPYVQMIAAGEELPFDVHDQRTISVDITDLDDVETAKEELERQVLALEVDPESLDTPISVAFDLQRLRQSDNPEQRSIAELVDMVSELRIEVGRMRTERADDVLRLAMIAEERAARRRMHPIDQLSDREKAVMDLRDRRMREQAVLAARQTRRDQEELEGRRHRAADSGETPTSADPQWDAALKHFKS
jgi:hypothetical protein